MIIGISLRPPADEHFSPGFMAKLVGNKGHFQAGSDVDTQPVSVVRATVGENGHLLLMFDVPSIESVTLKGAGDGDAQQAPAATG